RRRRPAPRAPSMRAAAATMSTSLRVSPSVHGARFDTALRKKAAGNIFASVGQEALQRLFRAAGDKRAEERARIVLAGEQDVEEKARALTALTQRRKDKLLQFLQLRRYSRKLC
ncbi:TCIM regulator, partial [Nothoprocta ornata]|nr:TCIM regulator [Nothoprocta pentlandii]NWY07358.1 TCIM regulator [Nothoprocta ornata]